MRLKKILIFTFFISLISCSVKEYDGIEIPYSIHIRTDFLDRKLRDVIKSALNYEPNAFKEFIELTKDFNKNERQLLLSFIRVGLEYGDNNYDGKMDNESIENVYVKIYNTF